MKFYKGKKKKKVKKSWALYLDSDGNALAAVDAETGYKIVDLIMFYDDGDICQVYNAHLALLSAGYDPYEHGNRFSFDGEIIIGVAG